MKAAFTLGLLQPPHVETLHEDDEDEDEGFVTGNEGEEEGDEEEAFGY